MLSTASREHPNRNKTSWTVVRLLVGLALAFTALAVSPGPGFGQTQSEPESVRYEVTFTGLFNEDALAESAQLPNNPHFRKIAGSVHNASVSHWESGGSASEGMKSLAEQGRTDYFKEEINEAATDDHAQGWFENSDRRILGEAVETLQFTATREFSLVTFATKINPSPDWFTGDQQPESTSQRGVGAGEDDRPLRVGRGHGRRQRFRQEQSGDRSAGCDNES